MIGLATIWNLAFLWVLLGPVVTRKPRPPPSENTTAPQDIPAQGNEPQVAAATATAAANRPTTVAGIRRKVSKLSRRVGTFILASIIILVLNGVSSFPSWWMIPLRAGWQRSVWNSDTICQGWDYEIIMDTVDFQQLTIDGNRSEFMLSNATILSTSSSGGGAAVPTVLMDLQHPSPYISVTTVHGDNGTSLFNFTIQYNFTEWKYYTSTNISGTFNDSSIFSFPSLGLTGLYPDIFWSPYCSSPRVSLVDVNHTEWIRTAIQSYDDCTQLKLCARGDIQQFAIPLGTIFIEMEKAGLCCTHPERSNHHFKSRR
jgi:hypothetical protein